MKIYKVPKRLNPEHGCGDDHEGFFYTLSKREANQFFKENGADPSIGDEIEEIDVAMNKESIIDMLNQYCSHPNNG